MSRRRGPRHRIRALGGKGIAYTQVFNDASDVELSDRRQSRSCRDPRIAQFGVRSRSDRRQLRGHPRWVAVHVSLLRERGRPVARDRTDRKSDPKDALAGSTVRRGFPGTRRVAAVRWARVGVETARSAAGSHPGPFALSLASCSLVATACSAAKSSGPGLFGAGPILPRACFRGLRRACRAERKPTPGRTPAPSGPAVTMLVHHVIGVGCKRRCLRTYLRVV
jgi:hypothetical protein